MNMNLSFYLFQQLEQWGVEHTFGIPGDFALPLYAQQAAYGMKTIVCVHEPGCVYAADAYARLKGLGVVLTTYGVGGLNMVNPMAMAYAEHSPVVVISGAPAVTGRLANPAFHHLVKDYGSQQRVFAEVTCATASLTDAMSAASEIDRVLDACLRLKRPGYIEIPLDMTDAEIPIPTKPANCSAGPSTNEAAVHEAAMEIVSAFESAERPVLYAGVGIRRHGLVEDVVKIVEKWGLTVISSVMGKASFPESHPHYSGVYMGKMGDEYPREVLENADFVLAAGVIFSDVNTGFWTAEIKRETLIEMRDLDVTISHHSFQGVPMSSLVPYLAALQPQLKNDSRSVIPRKTRENPEVPDNSQLTTLQLIHALQRLEESRFCFLADVGDAWFAGLEINADIFMAPGYYASMGFAVPGAVGAAIAAPKLRPIVLVGDGAFQMTGNELSTLIANRLNAIIIVLNNGYYKMLSALDGHREYYNLNNWNYVQYAESLGCSGVRAETGEQLAGAIEQALASSEPFVIEAVLQKEDHAPIMQRIKDFFEKSRGGRQ
ncbi:MAG: thiamine pyrophosphate-dependent enzyme [Desulforhopalus sp.]